ncbi:MAG: hypothetical protein QM503_06555 [Bacteroidota bacterium]
MRIYGINPSGGSSVNSYEYIAIIGQTEFPLEITLKSTTPVFVNGALLAKSEYLGVDTEILVLNTPCFAKEVIRIIE